MKTAIQVILVAGAIAGVLASASAEAGRPCRKMCRGFIRENVVEHCSPYTGVLKRLCKKDVRTTIVNFCRRQESGDCLGL